MDAVLRDFQLYYESAAAHPPKAPVKIEFVGDINDSPLAFPDLSHPSIRMTTMLKSLSTPRHPRPSTLPPMQRFVMLLCTRAFVYILTMRLALVTKREKERAKTIADASTIAPITLTTSHTERAVEMVISSTERLNAAESPEEDEDDAKDILPRSRRILWLALRMHHLAAKSNYNAIFSRDEIVPDDIFIEMLLPDPHHPPSVTHVIEAVVVQGLFSPLVTGTRDDAKGAFYEVAAYRTAQGRLARYVFEAQTRTEASVTDIPTLSRAFDVWLSDTYPVDQTHDPHETLFDHENVVICDILKEHGRDSPPTPCFAPGMVQFARDLLHAFDLKLGTTLASTFRDLVLRGSCYLPVDITFLENSTDYARTPLDLYRLKYDHGIHQHAGAVPSGAVGFPYFVHEDALTTESARHQTVVMICHGAMHMFVKQLRKLDKFQDACTKYGWVPYGEHARILSHGQVESLLPNVRFRGIAAIKAPFHRFRDTPHDIVDITQDVEAYLLQKDVPGEHNPSNINYLPEHDYVLIMPRRHLLRMLVDFLEMVPYVDGVATQSYDEFQQIENDSPLLNANRLREDPYSLALYIPTMLPMLNYMLIQTLWSPHMVLVTEEDRLSMAPVFKASILNPKLATCLESDLPASVSVNAKSASRGNAPLVNWRYVMSSVLPAIPVYVLGTLPVFEVSISPSTLTLREAGGDPAEVPVKFLGYDAVLANQPFVSLTDADAVLKLATPEGWRGSEAKEEKEEKRDKKKKKGKKTQQDAATDYQPYQLGISAPNVVSHVNVVQAAAIEALKNVFGLKTVPCHSHIELTDGLYQRDTQTRTGDMEGQAEQSPVRAIMQLRGMMVVGGLLSFCPDALPSTAMGWGRVQWDENHDGVHVPFTEGKDDVKPFAMRYRTDRALKEAVLYKLDDAVEDSIAARIALSREPVHSPSVFDASLKAREAWFKELAKDTLSNPTERRYWSEAATYLFDNLPPMNSHYSATRRAYAQELAARLARQRHPAIMSDDFGSAVCEMSEETLDDVIPAGNIVFGLGKSISLTEIVDTSSDLF